VDTDTEREFRPDRRVRGPVVVAVLLGLLVLPIPLVLVVAGIIDALRSIL
jgi:hypothetical protein